MELILEDKRMKKTLCVAFLLVLFNFSNSVFAISNIFIKNSTAENIAAKTNIKPSVMRLAVKAFARAKQMGIKIKQPIMTVIDYTLPSTAKRLWVINLETKQILYNSMVAHGKYSGENYTTSFSNHMGSLQSSVGLFLTENTYFGRDGYSLRLEGLEQGFNDKAKERLIVLHGAPYVNKKFADTAGRIGRSWGCPAVEPPLAKPIINAIKDGTLVFSFYNHSQWLRKSKFIA